jgi:hypothetical protein
MTAEGYLLFAYATLDSLFGGKGEWKPDDKAEHETMRDAAAGYLAASKGPTLTPGWLLVIAAGSYCWKRVTRSATAQKLAEWWCKLTGSRKTPQAPAKPDGTGAAEAVASVTPRPAPGPVYQPQIQIQPFR